MKHILLFALAAVGFVGSAPAAVHLDRTSQKAVTVRFGDLDLGTAEGVATLNERIAAAARRVCPMSGSLEERRIHAQCTEKAIATARRDVQTALAGTASPGPLDA